MVQNYRKQLAASGNSAGVRCETHHFVPTESLKLFERMKINFIYLCPNHSKRLSDSELEIGPVALARHSCSFLTIAYLACSNLILPWLTYVEKLFTFPSRNRFHAGQESGLRRTGYSPTFPRISWICANISYPQTSSIVNFPGLSLLLLHPILSLKSVLALALAA